MKDKSEMNPEEKAKRGMRIVDDCIMGKSFVTEQLKIANRELKKIGAEICHIENIDGVKFPSANVTISFSYQALDEYIAQFQQQEQGSDL